MIYLLLFFEFFKTGLFAVGGGLATLPFLYDIAGKYGWFSGDMLADMLAVSESTPGPIGVNMATYTGFTTAGAAGALVATLGLVLPSVIVIIIVAAFLNKFKENKYVQSAFYGLRPAVCGLIAAAALEVFKVSIVSLERFIAFSRVYEIINLKSLIIFAAVLLFTNKFKYHPIFYIIGAAVLGIALKM